MRCKARPRAWQFVDAFSWFYLRLSLVVISTTRELFSRLRFSDSLRLRIDIPSSPDRGAHPADGPLPEGSGPSSRWPLRDLPASWPARVALRSPLVRTSSEC